MMVLYQRYFIVSQERVSGSTKGYAKRITQFSMDIFVLCTKDMRNVLHSLVWIYLCYVHLELYSRTLHYPNYDVNI